ncbi:MAG: DUF393 domain-containing protein [Candidatus Sericytochromatia bacterium]
MENINIKDRNILLFDGECNFCNSSVNFIIDNNPNKDILFSSLQSNFGQNILEKYNLPKQNFNTLVFIEKEVCYIKSRAVFKIAKYLNKKYKYLSYFGVLPVFFTDIFYDIIAKNRYKLMGKNNSCRMPTKELKERFIN